MSEIELFHGDCRAVLREFGENCVDAIVTDPPYELTGSGSGGFMGKKWDASGVAFDVETWQQALRVLKPGGYLLAFGGTRTYHRVACAIEDAGFDIRDSIDWVYAQGMPKGLDVGKAFAKAGDAANAERWDGFGTALKPTHEPIVLARKPLVGTVMENALAHGTGGLNIDGCRVESLDENEGRYPPNTVFSHSPDCEQIGTRKVKTGTYVGHNRNETEIANKILGGRRKDVNDATYSSENGLEEIEAWNCTDDCPVAELDRQSGIRTSGAMKAGTPRATRKGHALGTMPEVTGTATEASEGGASRFFPTFRYEPKASRKDRGEGNNHPTVKPIALCQWLVRLVTPPGGVVLDMFAGSGTTLLAAQREGFDCVGIELEEPHLEIIRNRTAQ